MSRKANKPIVGTKYGQWIVISTNIKTSNLPNNRMVSWKVQCSCGKITFRDASCLRSGKTKACMSCAKTVYGEDTYIASYLARIKINLPSRTNKVTLTCNITVKYLENLFNKQNGKCALSGLPIGFEKFKNLSKSTASLDRIRSDKGYVKGNVQWVHKNINMMKGSLPESTFIHLCTLIYKHSKC